MKHLALGVAILISCAAAHAEPLPQLQGDTQVTAIISARAEQSPTIDGKLNDTCWINAGKVTGYYRASESAVAAERTAVYLAHDDKALYLAAIVADQHIAARERKRDAGTWEDDCVELFIDTKRQRRDEFQFIVSAAGMVFDANLGNYKWNASPDITVATAKYDGGWIAELAIPLAALGVERIARGDVWDIKLTREDYDKLNGTPRISSWIQVGKSFHDAGAFGELIFESRNRARNGDVALGLISERWCNGAWRATQKTGADKLALADNEGHTAAPSAKVMHGGYAQVQVCVPVTPLRSYRVIAWVNRDAMDPNGRLSLKHERNDEVSASARNKGWQKLETFIQMGDSKYMPLTFTSSGSGSGYYLIDDLSVEEVDATPRNDKAICYTGNASGVLARHNQRVDGHYTYYDLATRSAFFPQDEERGDGDVELHAGWIPFAKGELTDGKPSFIKHHHWTISPGKSIVFDLGADRYITDVQLKPVERSLQGLRVFVKPDKAAHYTFAAEPDVLRGDVSVKDINCHARFIRIDFNGECGWREIELWGEDRQEVVAPHAVATTASQPAEGGPALADGGFDIFPTPKHATVDDDYLPLPSPITIALADDSLRDAVRAWADTAAARFGPPIDIGSTGAIGITLGDVGDHGEEAYRLKINSEGMAIIGASRQGVINALHTLTQCLTARGDTIVARHVDVHDWPTYSFRAMQIWPRQLINADAQHMVETIARFKLNQLVLEGNETFVLPFAKKLAPLGMASTVRAASMPANAWFRDVIEMNPGETVADLPALSRVNPCPSNPKTYELIDKEIAAAAQFPGRYININCDEMYQEHKGARWGVCDLCTASGLSGTDLFVKLITYIHTRAKAVGKTPMMLDTMYCVPYKMPGAFEKLPRDIPIMIWHPNVQGGLTELGYNIGEFFDSDTWSIDETKPNVIGGFVPGDGGLKLEKTALFAEALWSGQYPDTSDPRTLRRLAEKMADIHEAIVGAPLPSRSAMAEQFTTIDLAPAANCTLADTAAGDDAGLFDLGSGSDLSFMAGQHTINGAPIHIGDKIVVLENRGALDARFDTQRSVPINRKAASLLFYHTVTTPPAWTYAAQLTHIGNYIITYADGSRIWMPIEYKQNILEHDALTGGASAGYKSKLVVTPRGMPAYDGMRADGESILLMQAEWVNPYPDKVIATVDMTSASRMLGGRVALFAMTAVAPSPRDLRLWAGRTVATLPAQDTSISSTTTPLDLSGGTYESETRYVAPDGTTLEADSTYTLGGATLIARMKVGYVTVDNNLGWQTQSEKGGTLTITLPKPRALAGIRLRGLPQSPEYVFENRLAPMGYAVQVTADGKTWQQVADNDNYQADRDGAIEHHWKAEPIKAVRITLRRAGPMYCSVYGLSHVELLEP